MFQCHLKIHIFGNYRTTAMGLKLSVVIPVFNEEKTIKAILDRVVSGRLMNDMETCNKLL